jgi:hypothetical protein
LVDHFPGKRKGFSLLHSIQTGSRCGDVAAYMQPHHHTHTCILIAISTIVTLASTSDVLPDDGVTAPKRVGAVSMSILMYFLKLFLRQFTCASVGELKNFDNIKMHGMYVKIIYFIYYIFIYLYPNSHIGAQLNIGTTLRLRVTVSLRVTHKT